MVSVVHEPIATNCPSCGEPMRRGEVRGRPAVMVWWTPPPEGAKRLDIVLAPIEGRERGIFRWRDLTRAAARCDACRLIVFRF